MLLRFINWRYKAFWYKLVDDIVYDLGFLQSDFSKSGVCSRFNSTYACVILSNSPSLTRTCWGSAAVARLVLRCAPATRRSERHFECMFETGFGLKANFKGQNRGIKSSFHHQKRETVVCCFPANECQLRSSRNPNVIFGFASGRTCGNTRDLFDHFEKGRQKPYLEDLLIIER